MARFAPQCGARAIDGMNPSCDDGVISRSCASTSIGGRRRRSGASSSIPALTSTAGTTTTRRRVSRSTVAARRVRGGDIDAGLLQRAYELEALNARFGLVVLAPNRRSMPSAPDDLQVADGPPKPAPPSSLRGRAWPRPPPRRSPGTSQPGELRQNLRYRSIETAGHGRRRRCRSLSSRTRLGAPAAVTGL